MHTPLRWALIGASDIAATQVLPALRRLGHDAVVVVSSDAGRAEAYAAEHDIGRGTTSVQEAVGADVDAVYVSTTNDKHAEGVHAAVEAGRHVLCEKPLAITLDDAQGMVDAAAKAGVVMATNHHLRNAPVHRALRKLVAEGALGELLGVRVAHAVHLPARLRGWRIAAVPGSGVVFDITVHDADAVRFVTGLDPVEVAAVGLAQGLAEGTVDAVAVAGRLSGGTGDGASLHLHDAYTVPHTRTAFEVFGTEGSALATDAMTQTPDGDVLLRRTGRDDEVVDVGERENLYDRGLQAFSAAVAGDGDPPCTGADGVRSLAVALAVQESLDSGRRTLVRACRPAETDT
jgi:1,5-anhydro-D-fructose reductase (1,5-anhydro-D-mannitol-forming)